MCEYLRLNCKFPIFEWTISIRIFGHMLNNRLQHCYLNSVEFYLITIEEREAGFGNISLQMKVTTMPFANSVQLDQVALYRKAQPDNSSKRQTPIGLMIFVIFIINSKF